MNIKNKLLLVMSHLAIGIIGFAVGIYSLPILTEPPTPSATEIAAKSVDRKFSTSFTRDLKDSDALHWGEGDIVISEHYITFTGKLAPGPNYKLYLSPTFVETEVDFKRLNSTMVEVDDILTFTNFIANIPQGINTEEYNSLIIWCESFGEFITSAQYQ
ncbi:DM13 domain-containing protein [Thalassotalea eurytherma]|uniref:DM13 domain-containing protein n=1 Tax=Thalassotalea eurytherma TaxID=1144278 RepID=A0ABQ6H626_9GAMM|nr:DM13 domain-containing protein [Thalassotalea eurytherma]GLX83608.1 hypothetical protein theurythT_30610 [Thalassotalea eurytherma]